MEILFDHEKLTVYQKAIAFTAWVGPVIDQLPKTASVRNQLDRASTSIPLNIAEGNGKWTKKDRCRYFDIAKGSAVECAAALDVSVARDYLGESEVTEGKKVLLEVVRMLIGLIKVNDPEREFGNARLEE